MGSFFQNAAPSALFDCPALPLAAGAADPAAAQLLDRALARLAPDKVQWLSMTVWQRVQDDDLCYEAEGRFQAAPGLRRRLNLRVTVGSTVGQVRVFSDGRRLVHSSQVGAEPAAVRQVNLPAQPAGAGDAVLRQHGLGGVQALLLAVRQHLTQPRREVIVWGGSEVIRITGEWPVNAARLAALPDLPGSAVPRRCRVYLDARTLWPRRVEWWGTEKGGAGVLLSQVEFRDPILNRPLSPERCAREFAWTPQGAKSSAAAHGQPQVPPSGT
jgi:hypothetical protein